MICMENLVHAGRRSFSVFHRRNAVRMWIFRTTKSSMEGWRILRTSVRRGDQERPSVFSVMSQSHFLISPWGNLDLGNPLPC